MVKESEPQGQLEWRINMPDVTSERLVPERISQYRIYRVPKGLVMGLVSEIWGFLQKAWKLGANEPKKVMHCFKVGMALTLVSLFYYMRPLYDGVGGNNAIWAVMTVVVVFEYTVGATLGKCVNRAIGTVLAGALGVGVHWVATQSGDKFEPVILQFSVFLLAAAATFSRFIPSIKERFDYGTMVFILTFSLISVSGYRVEKLFELAHDRLSTIAIGTTICVLISMLFCPVWAGNELHKLIKNNIEKLSDSLDGCVADYFRDDVKDNAKNDEASGKLLHGYKCVLNSKATEESLANLARWEPSHGNFSFGHPWKEYIKVGASLRSCAYCIEALNGTITSETKAPDFLKKHFSKFCLILSANSSAVLKELAITIATMTRSSEIDLTVKEMKIAVQELQNAVASLSKQPIGSTQSGNGIGKGNVNPTGTTLTLVEIIPLVTVSSLLIDIAARIEKIVETVNGLAAKAEFRQENKDDKTMMTVPKV